MKLDLDPWLLLYNAYVNVGMNHTFTIPKVIHLTDLHTPDDHHPFDVCSSDGQKQVINSPEILQWIVKQ